MKRIIVINPNSSEAMTEAIIAAVREVEQRPKTPGHVQILQGLPPHAPRSIDNAVDEVKSAAAFWDAGVHKDWPDVKDFALLVACFSDHPLTGMLRHAFPKATVLNILEAGVIKALAAGQKFGIVTTTEDFVEEFKRAIANIIGPNNDRFVGTFATGYTAIQLKTESSKEIATRVQAAAETLLRKGATVIILGCSGMSGMEAAIRSAETAVGLKKPVRIIDGIKAGLTLLYSIIDEE